MAGIGGSFPQKAQTPRLQNKKVRRQNDPSDSPSASRLPLQREDKGGKGLRQAAPPCKGETRNERSLSIAGDVQAKNDGIFLPILPYKGGCRTGAGGSQMARALSSVLSSCLSAGCPILRFLQCGYMRSNVSKSLTNAHKKTMIVSRSNAKQGRDAMSWIGGA